MDVQITDIHSTEHSLKVLLAEDNAVNQTVALRILAKCGYHADVACDGLEVLRALERRVYDVILMDVHMPQMSGLEATRRIRQHHPATTQPYIIAMTANLMDGDAEVCLAAGMNAYINKPMRPAELTEALRQAANFSLNTTVGLDK